MLWFLMRKKTQLILAIQEAGEVPCRSEVRAPLRVSSSALSASEGSAGIIGAWDGPRQPHLSRRSLPPTGQKTQVKGETDNAHDVMKTPQDKTFRPADPSIGLFITWCLGRVERALPSREGLVASCQMKGAGGHPSSAGVLAGGQGPTEARSSQLCPSPGIWEEAGALFPQITAAGAAGSLQQSNTFLSISGAPQPSSAPLWLWDRSAPLWFWGRILRNTWGLF